MSEVLRVALVGLGRAGQRHLRAIHDSENMSLAATADPAIASNSSQPHYQTVEDLLSAEQTELVVIASPDGFHGPQTMACFAAGSHVVCEKPFSTELAMAQQVLASQQKNHLFVVKQLRYHGLFQQLKANISAGAMGQVNLVQFNLFWHRGPEYFANSSWHGDARLDGGILANQAIHYIDLLYWWFGLPEEVSALGSNQGRLGLEFDTVLLQLKWPGGLLGQINVSYLAFEKNFNSSVTMLSERANLVIAGQRFDKIESAEGVAGELGLENYQLGQGYENEYRLFYENVIDSIKGRAAPAIDGQEALQSLRIIEAARISLAEKKAVRVSEVYA